MFLKILPSFYAASSLRRTDGLDSPDQRITTDIAEFSRKLSHLYGHSFSPVLNFILSLFEASKDLGKASDRPFSRSAHSSSWHPGMFFCNPGKGTKRQLSCPH